MDRRRELGEFLRARRASLRPEDVGLTAGRRRRVAGLRRDEAAQRAGVSVEYYTRLEQGRGGRPSGEVLAALATALDLTPAARDHLVRLAARGPSPGFDRPAVPSVGDTPGGLRPSVRALLDAMPTTPAVAYGVAMEVLAMNPPATALYAALPGWTPGPANCARTMFLEPAARAWYLDWEEAAGDVVALLRRSDGEHPGEPRRAALVDELAAGSEDFRRMWATHDVRQELHGRKRLRHPELGELVIDFELLPVPGADVVLTVYTAPPGSPTRAALDRLAERASPTAPPAQPAQPATAVTAPPSTTRSWAVT